MTNLSLETNLKSQGYHNIAGVDEVGRGPWAGPVVAAAVILNPNVNLPSVTDSKKLSASQRESLIEKIKSQSHWAIAEASVEEIDTINIREATFLAMQRAIKKLKQTPDFALIDGNATPKSLPCPAQSVIKGDNHSLSIAAASILAKVYRDTLMAKLHHAFPHYGWHTNAGYGTATHQAGLAQYGLTPHHRTSFKPIKALLQKAS